MNSSGISTPVYEPQRDVSRTLSAYLRNNESRNDQHIRKIKNEVAQRWGGGRGVRLCCVCVHMPRF